MKLKEDKKSETVIERHGPYGLVDWFGQLAIKNLAENLWLVVNKNSLVFDLWKKIKRSNDLPSHEEIEDMEKGINEMEHIDEISDETKMNYLDRLPVNMRDLAHNQIPAAQREVDRQFQLAQWKKDRPDWRNDPDLLAAEKVLQRLLHKYGKRQDLWAELNAPEESVTITPSKSSIIEGILNSSVFTPGDIFEIQINDKEIVRTFVESVNSDSLVLYADDEMYRILNESFPGDDVVDDMFDFVMAQLKMMKMEPASEEDFRKKIEFIITGYIKINKPEYSQQDVQLMADDLVGKMMNLYRNKPKRTLHEKGFVSRNLTRIAQKIVDRGGDEGLLANVKPGEYIVDSMDDSGTGKPVQFRIYTDHRKNIHNLSISSYSVPRLPDGRRDLEAEDRIKRYVISKIRSNEYEPVPTKLQARHDRFRNHRAGPPIRPEAPSGFDGNWIDEGKDPKNLKMIERIKNMIELHRNLPGHEKQIAELEGMLRQLQGQNSLEEAEYRGRKVPLGKPMQGDVKKFKVYVKDPKTGNVKKVNFGDKNMRIKKSNPKRRKSFRARHNCDNPGPRTKARYWSCRKW